MSGDNDLEKLEEASQKKTRALQEQQGVPGGGLALGVGLVTAMAGAGLFVGFLATPGVFGATMGLLVAGLAAGFVVGAGVTLGAAQLYQAYKSSEKGEHFDTLKTNSTATPSADLKSTATQTKQSSAESTATADRRKVHDNDTGNDNGPTPK